MWSWWLAESVFIELQEEIIQCKNNQLKTLENTVKNSVEDSVKSEFKSYSAVVMNNLPPSSIAPEAVKTIVNTVVEEEDRSRSIIIFGLPEESAKGEQ